MLMESNIFLWNLHDLCGNILILMESARSQWNRNDFHGICMIFLKVSLFNEIKMISIQSMILNWNPEDLLLNL